MKCPNCSHEFDNDNDLVEVFAVEWTEFEHDGWASQRGDGLTLHTSEELAKDFTMKREKNGTYNYFFRGSKPKKALIKKKLLSYMKDSQYGKVIWIDEKASQNGNYPQKGCSNVHCLELDKSKSV